MKIRWDDLKHILDSVPVTKRHSCYIEVLPTSHESLYDVRANWVENDPKYTQFYVHQYDGHTDYGIH